MELAFALLARHADLPTGPEGMLTIVGAGLDGLTGPFPLVADPLVLVVKLVLQGAETRAEHLFAVDITGPGFRLSEDSPYHFTVPPPEAGSDSSNTVIVGNFSRVEFPTPGIYHFHVRVDGTELKNVPLRAVAGSQAAQPAATRTEAAAAE
jgi:hypothetical protein